MSPPLEFLAVATNLVPSADEATDVQLLAGAVVGVKIMPEFVEI